jgi:hypothetical protein
MLFLLGAASPLSTFEARAEDGARPRPDQSATSVAFSGRLRQAGQRQELAGARVVVADAGELQVGVVSAEAMPRTFRWILSTTTDDAGRFSFTRLARGKVLVLMSCDTCERRVEVVDLRDDKNLDIERYLQPLNASPYRTVVESQARASQTIGAQVLSTQEVATMPGSGGDLARALQNLPGVARGAFGLADLRIRGAAPGDSQMIFGDHPVPTLLHFGGFNAIVQVQALASVEFVPGNFAARYGNAIGGIVRGVPRAGRRDGYHGHAKIDLFDAGILAEGPIGRGSFLIAGRRSYGDVVMKGLLPDDLHLAPRAIPAYYDGQLYFDHPLGRKATFSAHLIGSHDRSSLAFLDRNENLDGNEPPRSAFFRVDAAVRGRWHGWNMLTSAAYGKAGGYQETYALAVKRRADLYSWRQEGERVLSPRVRVLFGAEIQYERGKNDYTQPYITETGTTTTHFSFTRFSAGLYSRTHLKLGEHVEVLPEARFGVPARFLDHDLYVLAEPRIETRVRYGRSRLRVATGSYAQGSTRTLPGQQESAEANFGLQRSWQTSVGLDRDLRWDLRVESTFFHKHLWNLQPDSEQGEAMNPARGRIVGGEFLLRKVVNERVHGWIAYTLMRSERAAHSAHRYRLDKYDQTHLLSALASIRLPRRWTIGARFRLTSGNLYTPVIGSFFRPDTATSGGNYQPIYGEIYSQRTPMFYQFDLRIDKTWIFNRLSLSAFLDLFNATNALNVESYQPDYAARKGLPVYSVPIFPALGLKVEY